jgi:predicted RNase H-like HicB family nuclease
LQQHFSIALAKSCYLLLATNLKSEISNMDYTIIVEQDAQTGFYSGQCQQLPEAITQGKTMDELLDNMREAIALVLEEQEQSVISSYAGHKFFRRKLTIS